MIRLGDSFTCPEANTMLSAVQAAGHLLAQVAQQDTDAQDGSVPVSQWLSNDPIFDQVSAYVDRGTSAWSAPLVGDACKNAVLEGRQLLARVNAILTAHGVAPIPDPGVVPGSGGGIDDLMGTLKTVAIAAAVIAGVVVVAPLVFDFTAARKAKRRLAGRNRRSR